MTRSHPVSELLEAAAAGQQPTAEELAALGLPPESRARLTREIRDAAAEAVAHRLEGASGPARAVAREAANRIVAETGDLRGTEEPMPTDPTALADLIHRH